jgi:septum formation protein
MSLPIVLGSSSVWRKEVMKNLLGTLDIETISPDIDEKAIRDKDPSQLTLKIARAKSKALLERLKHEGHQPCILVCSDQVVCFGDKQGEIREKPETIEQAKQFLRSYRLKPAVCVASVVVTNTLTGKQTEGVDWASQYFKPNEMTESLFDELIK